MFCRRLVSSTFAERPGAVLSSELVYVSGGNTLETIRRRRALGVVRGRSRSSSDPATARALLGSRRGRMMLILPSAASVSELAHNRDHTRALAEAGKIEFIWPYRQKRPDYRLPLRPLLPSGPCDSPSRSGLAYQRLPPPPPDPPPPRRRHRRRIHRHHHGRRHHHHGRPHAAWTR